MTQTVSEPGRETPVVAETDVLVVGGGPAGQAAAVAAARAGAEVMLLERYGYLGGLAAWAGFTLPSAIILILFAYGAGALGPADIPLEAVDRIIESESDHARFFLGMVVWRPGQLDDELDRGLWFVDEPEAKLVLRRKTDGLWEELVRRLEAREHTI